MDIRFHISELAGLYGVNSDTLRYYEELGLLKPEREKNGYRAYSMADLCNLNVIRSMRELGIGLEEICGYFQDRSVRGAEKMLESQEHIIEEKIAGLQENLKMVRRRRKRLIQAMSSPEEEVRHVTLKKRPYVSLQQPDTPEREVDYLLKRLEQKHHSQLKGMGSWCMGAVLDQRAMEEKTYDHYNTVFFLCGGGEESDGALPSGSYLSIVHAGRYEEIGRSYEALFACAAAEGLTPQGPPIELYLTDIHDTADENEFRTEIQILTNMEQASEN